ncbi:MAG TPA: GNAT family N-acetyltransferase [Planctomycetota bacterium]|nr:GNAT family N-acetyltransferase [Planctomycetota bacterium]
MLLVQEATQELAVARARELVQELPLIENLFVHADLTPPLAERTRVFLGFAPTGDLRAVGTAYLGLGKPALAVAVLGEKWDQEVARALLAKMREGIDLPAIVIDEPAREAAYAAAFTVKDRHEELHYILRPGVTLPIAESIPVETVTKNDLPALDRFLRQHGATAWSTESFDAGPYVWVREGNEVVAAAGVHFETPFIGQIANVLVRESHRKKGLGAAVTAAIARRLRERDRIVSLFVKADNEPAKRIYERLGFKRVRSLVYLELA